MTCVSIILRGNNVLIARMKALISCSPTSIVLFLLLPRSLWKTLPDVIKEGIKSSELLVFYKQQMEPVFINSKL